MIAIFIKEMRQFRRGYAGFIASGLLALAIIAALIMWKTRINTELIVIAANFLAVIIISGESASNWRRELGDPAFSPGVTTTIPPLFIALGKMTALLTQLLIFSLLFFAVIIAGRIIYANILREIVLPAQIITTDLGTVIRQMFHNYALSYLAALIALSASTLTICSIKPRRKSGFDLGSWAAILVVAVMYVLPNFSISISQQWQISFLCKTLIIWFGALFLISARVAANNSDRLMPFKIYLLLTMLVLYPFAAKLFNSSHLRFEWSNTLINLVLVFALSSWFERQEQSRRVLCRQVPEFGNLLIFPITTGALNSLSVSLLLFTTAGIVTKFDIFGYPGLAETALLLLASSVAHAGAVLCRKKFRIPVFPIALVLFAAGTITLSCYRSKLSMLPHNYRYFCFAALWLLTISAAVPLILNYRRKLEKQ